MREDAKYGTDKATYFRLFNYLCEKDTDCMMEIRPMNMTDAEAIAGIYSYYTEHTVITFDTEKYDRTAMQKKLAPIVEKYPAFVCLEGDNIVGYCYAHEWKEKPAYRHTAEVTIYLHPAHTRQGYGAHLMQHLIKACRAQGLHNLIACITWPNENSTEFHEKMGFRQVSHFKGVGFKFGRRLDVADYELTLQ